jgi:hypothetical protein
MVLARVEFLHPDAAASRRVPSRIANVSVIASFDVPFVVQR